MAKWRSAEKVQGVKLAELSSSAKWISNPIPAAFSALIALALAETLPHVNNIAFGTRAAKLLRHQAWTAHRRKLLCRVVVRNSCRSKAASVHDELRWTTGPDRERSVRTSFQAEPILTGETPGGFEAKPVTLEIHVARAATIRRAF